MKLALMLMYVQWVNRVCEHVKALGKRPMFWGDIIAAHPEDHSRTARGCNLHDMGLQSGTARDTNVQKALGEWRASVSVSGRSGLESDDSPA